ncbi:coiled-coil domain-containing protein 113 [Silurus meridionalis]|uniref:coiled-coil domain-containing protein 113 n=1 Tax=Silurus meridionalis TaxID=175797 RepID=UPI001EEA9AC5|nr:coiled-coil domain-containing protein 113 [Silurus meridionalis]
MTESSEQVELRRSNSLLELENEMFESFLSRLDSLKLDSQPAYQMETGAVNHETKPESSETSQELPNVLKVELKYYIAVCELEKMRKEQHSTRSAPVYNAKYYKSSIEDSERRLAEIKRERHDFEEFVAEAQQTTLGQSQRAQKVIQYIERDIKTKKALTERMRRRNRFLQMQTMKQRQHSVNQKEQMQETVCPINLEHLKQKNTQSEELLQKSQEQVQYQRALLRKNQQGLNAYQERLKKEMQKSELLSKKITSHEEKLSKIREQQQKAEKERAQAEVLNKKLKTRLANFRVPDVMKYIEAKTTNDRLRQTVKTLERKERIAQMASKTKKTSTEDHQAAESAMTTDQPKWTCTPSCRGASYF